MAYSFEEESDMMHFTTPKRDKARDHLQRINNSLDEMMNTMRPAPWLSGNDDRLKILHERRDSAVRYMKRFRR